MAPRFAKLRQRAARALSRRLRKFRRYDGGPLHSDRRNRARRGRNGRHPAGPPSTWLAHRSKRAAPAILRRSPRWECAALEAVAHHVDRGSRRVNVDVPRGRPTWRPHRTPSFHLAGARLTITDADPARRAPSPPRWVPPPSSPNRLERGGFFSDALRCWRLARRRRHHVSGGPGGRRWPAPPTISCAPPAAGQALHARGIF